MVNALFDDKVKTNDGKKRNKFIASVFVLLKIKIM